MTTDFRALCAELIASWDADGCDWKPQHQARWEATVNRARAALAEPECREPAAVTGQPSDGEVAELVEWLREQLHVCLQAPWTPGIKHFGRAAELLERLSPPQPVPVSERLPGPEDCDAEKRCWWFCPTSVLPNGMLPYWCLGPADPPKSWFTHCLPAHALPLPEVNNG